MQGDLFPHPRPETVLAYVRRLEARIYPIAPELTAAQCSRILGEISLAEQLLDQIDFDIRTSQDWQLRHALAPLPLTTAIPATRVPDQPRRAARRIVWRVPATSPRYER